MDKHTVGLLVGGLLPAVLFGLTGVVQASSARSGIGTGPFLVIVGLTVVVFGLAASAVQGDAGVSWESAGRSAVFGLLWAAGIGCIGLALGRYEAQISQLAPLYNMNTLVAVLLGLVALGEWQAVHPGRLVLAAVLTVAGGVLAVSSTR